VATLFLTDSGPPQTTVLSIACFQSVMPAAALSCGDHSWEFAAIPKSVSSFAARHIETK
jgi:hypothetical protein